MKATRRPRTATKNSRKLSVPAGKRSALPGVEDRYYALFHNNPFPVWVYDIKTLRFLDVNQEAVKQYGYSREEFLSRTIKDIRPEGEWPRLLESVAHVAPESETTSGWKHIRKDGALIDVDVSSHKTIYDGREARLVVAANVTEKLKDQRALQASERRLTMALEGAQMGIWELDLQTGKTYRTLRHDQTFGYAEPLEDWGYEKFLTHVYPDDLEKAKRSFESALATGTLRMECRVIWPDKTVHWILAKGRIFDNENGKPGKMMGTIRETTETKKAEAEIEQLNRDLHHRSALLAVANQELEAFCYSVAHDLRAPLRGIDGFSRAVIEDYARVLDDTGKDYLARIRSAAQRMAELIEDLLKLSRVTRAEMNMSEVDLSSVARSICEAQQSAEPHRSVEIDIAPGLQAYGDPKLLCIALENLFSNAWKFTSKKEHARIVFGVSEKDREPCYWVRDDGAGFDMTYMDRLFGPFQRLHGMNEFPGTGIGLATVQRIIHRHGGRVWAEGKVGEGATFYFTLGSA